MEMIIKDGTVTAVSIYSDRVLSCIAYLDKELSPCVIGLGKSDGKFIGKKGVLDIDTLSKAISESSDAAQKEAGFETTKVFVSVSGGNVSCEKSRGMIKLSQRGAEISNKHVKNVIKMASTIPVDMEKQIIHLIPQDFTIDGQESVRNPVGLYGVKLEAEALLITVQVAFLLNIVKSANLAGVEVEEIVFSGVAAGKSALSHDTEGKGSIILDIDSHSSSMSFFFDNILRSVRIWESSAFSDALTKDLQKNISDIRASKPVSKILLIGCHQISEDTIDKVESISGTATAMGYVRNIKGRSKEVNNPSYITPVGLAKYGLERRSEEAFPHRRRPKLTGGFFKKIGDFFDEYF